MTDLLLRARFNDKEEMISSDEDIGLTFYKSSQKQANVNAIIQVFALFLENYYDGEWLLTGCYVSTLRRFDKWSGQEYKCIWKKAYGYFLKDGHLWKHPK